MRRGPWSDAEVERLRTMCAEGATLAMLCEAFGREPNATYSKANKLGFSVARGPRPKGITPAGSFWNEANEAQLRVLCGEGHSASQIGIRLGATRNQVIGKVLRLGLMLGASPSRAAPSAPRSKGALTAAAPAAPAPHRPKLPPTTPSPVRTKPDTVMATARPFTERKIGECWWPIGEGVGMLSCCAPVERGGLCAEHAKRGYQRASTETDRKRAASSFLYHAGRTQQGYVAGKRGGALAE